MPIPQEKILLSDGLSCPSDKKKYSCGMGRKARPSYLYKRYNVKSNYAELGEQISIVPIPGGYSTRGAYAPRTLG